MLNALFLLVALAVGDPVKSPGFALYCIEGDGTFAGDWEARAKAVIVTADDPKLIGKYRRGDAIAKPFQDWRIVGFPERPNKRPSVVVTNVKHERDAGVGGDIYWLWASTIDSASEGALMVGDCNGSLPA